MAEGTANVEGGLNQGISRRALLKGAAIGVGVMGAAAAEAKTGIFSTTFGIVGRALEAFLNRPTEEQLKAAKELEREDLVRVDYEVIDHPDIIKMGGLAVRKDPYIPTKPKAGTTFSYLQPGYTIKGTIDWEGGNVKFPEKQGKFKDWIAFKDDQGRVGFVANNSDYLKRVSPPANP